MILPMTQELFDACMIDVFPSQATCEDFGVDDPDHFGAIQHYCKSWQFNITALDEALGDGSALTELICSDEKNPYREVVFTTPYDCISVGDNEVEHNDDYTYDEL